MGDGGRAGAGDATNKPNHRQQRMSNLLSTTQICFPILYLGMCQRENKLKEEGEVLLQSPANNQDSIEKRTAILC